MSEVTFDMKVELENIFEQKIHEWLSQVENYTSEKQCKNKVELDFWQKIVPMNADTDGDGFNELLTDDEIVTSITLCYDLT